MKQTWEADFRALPKPAGQAETHYLGVVAALPKGDPLHYLPVEYTPNVNDPADLLADAKGLKPRGAEVAAVRTAWGWTAEFKLPWANFPGLRPRVGEVIGVDCELCGGDGGPRADRTFVYSSPAAVATPAAFGRVRVVGKLDPGGLRPRASPAR